MNEDLVLFNPRIIMRNFAGRKGQYNAEGVRSFAVTLTPEQAEQATSIGYNVKQFEPRPEMGETKPTYWLKVAVSYPEAVKYHPTVRYYPTHDKSHPVELTKDTVALIDTMDIDKCAVQVRARHWEVNGSKGVKAMLKRIDVYPVISELDSFDPYGTGESVAIESDALPESF